MLRQLLIAFAVVLFTFLPSTFYGQQSEATAVQILEQAVAASGGREACKQSADFHAAGTLSLYSAGEVVDTGNATLVGSGLKRFRLTATLADETRTWIWKDGAGFLLAKGQTDPIGPHNLSALEGIAFPIVKIIALLDGHSNSIQFVETLTVDGRESYRIRIIQTPKEKNDRLLLGRDSATTDVLFDKETLSIVAVEDRIYPNGHLRESFQHSVVYGDYRSINGVQVPFSIRERISGQLTWGLQLSSFSPGATPSSSEFQLN